MKTAAVASVLVFPLVLGAVVGSCLPASAQTVVARDVIDALGSSGTARVLIVTRPDAQASDGRSFVPRTDTYVRSILGASARNVAPVGSLPITVAEISEDALERLRADPGVVLVARDNLQPPSLVESVPL